MGDLPVLAAQDDPAHLASYQERIGFALPVAFLVPGEHGGGRPVVIRQVPGEQRASGGQELVAQRFDPGVGGDAAAPDKLLVEGLQVRVQRRRADLENFLRFDPTRSPGLAGRR